MQIIPERLKLRNWVVVLKLSKNICADAKSKLFHLTNESSRRRRRNRRKLIDTEFGHQRSADVEYTRVNKLTFMKTLRWPNSHRKKRKKNNFKKFLESSGVSSCSGDVWHHNSSVLWQHVECVTSPSPETKLLPRLTCLKSIIECLLSGGGGGGGL